MNGAQTFSELFLDQGSTFLEQVVAYAPNILGAVAIVLIALILGALLRFIVSRLVSFSLLRVRRWRRISDEQVGERDRALSRLSGRLVFWFVLLLSIAPAIDVLGIEAVSSVLSGWASYLPRLLGAALILLLSHFFGDLARSSVEAAARRMGVTYPHVAGRVIQAMIWAMAIMIVINQLGIESTALLILLAAVVGSAFGASALAFGLGARVTVGNIIASHYARKEYTPGQRIAINGLEGTIDQITRTHVILRTDDGAIAVPASRFSEQDVHTVPSW
jgi:small-conductance mechanosensitive channel